jgi:hypothetical protein
MGAATGRQRPLIPRGLETATVIVGEERADATTCVSAHAPARVRSRMSGITGPVDRAR